jgi:hypothetical protein
MTLERRGTPPPNGLTGVVTRDALRPGGSWCRVRLPGLNQSVEVIARGWRCVGCMRRAVLCGGGLSRKECVALYVPERGGATVYECEAKPLTGNGR